MANGVWLYVEGYSVWFGRQELSSIVERALAIDRLELGVHFDALADAVRPTRRVLAGDRDLLGAGEGAEDE